MKQRNDFKSLNAQTSIPVQEGNYNKKNGNSLTRRSIVVPCIITDMADKSFNPEKATLAGGCFWCTEAIYKRLLGVITVTPGYTGGTTHHPTYADVCSGKTGHVEAIEIMFYPQKISYEQLLTIFWHSHDPTSRDKQGSDIGMQYRSVILFHSPMQQSIAENSKRTESQKMNKFIVTEIIPATAFYPAEPYHHNYYDNNSHSGYCQFVIHPKITTLVREYNRFIKPEFKNRSSIA